MQQAVLTRPTPQLTGEVIVRAEGLTKRYGSVNAVDHLSFDVHRGEILGFLGPNGAGKSTTIAMLLRLIRPTAGGATLFGLPESRAAEGLQRVGAIIESPAFYPYLSGFANLRALAKLRPGVTDARIREVLGIVGLGDTGKKPYKAFSLGMKQRLGIGWALLADPDLLILDEPTNGLDPAGQAELRALMERLAAEGKTIFISSHLLKDIQEICTRVIIIKHGQFVVTGTVEQLLSTNLRLLIRSPNPGQARDFLHDRLGIADATIEEGAVMIPVTDRPPSEINRELVLAGIAVDELRPAGSLEDVFLGLTSDEAPAADHAMEAN